MGILDKIVWSPLNDGQYIREAVPKHSIYIHHTAGSASPQGVKRWWNETTTRVGTAFIIGGKPTRPGHTWKDGELVQVFSSKHWAYHLGLKKSNMPPGSASSKYLNSSSIGIELCNWGYLSKRDDDKYYTYVNSVVPAEDVVDLGYEYRGHRYWHKYTDAQLDVLEELIMYLVHKYNIPAQYKGDKMFELDIRAFVGQHGIWTHTSVREDKTDCSPQPHLLEMLRRIGTQYD